MGKMGVTQRKWLKSFHILFPSIWVGSGFSMIFLMMVKSQSINTMYSIWHSIKLIDVLFVAIPNILTLITGLMMAKMTNWGLKHTWIKVKLFINIVIAIIGGTFMRNLIDKQLVMLKTGEPSVLENSAFLSNSQVLVISTLLIMLAVIFAIFISVIKPWDKRRKNKQQKVDPLNS
ncbi:DUF2269 family protein [Geobacillus vulcani]|uniref:DUF2269 family protein n=1 Tax=Geobacillus vulcani TaxID=135517 RepID=UPI0004DFA8DB|nr:DUF2269 family protein [Geobacillus vulcani]